MIETLFTIKHTTYKIRPMILADLPEVKIIRDQCLPFIHDKVSYDLPATMEWLKTTESKYLSVIDELNTVIGYFRLTDISKDHCFVGMDLHQDHRGKGIALNTYNAVMTELKKYGICNFSLYVLSNNEHAIRLYNHIGFKEIESAPWNISEAGIIYNISMTTMEI
jgi:ribosomal protein S18 acetylase RimI-like enzyme